MYLHATHTRVGIRGLEGDANLLGLEAVGRQVGEVLGRQVRACFRQPFALLGRKGKEGKVYGPQSTAYDRDGSRDKILSGAVNRTERA